MRTVYWCDIQDSICDMLCSPKYLRSSAVDLFRILLLIDKNVGIAAPELGYRRFCVERSC